MNISTWLKSLFTKSTEVKNMPLVLNIQVNSQPADGSAANSVQAVVTDAAGAPVVGAAIKFSASAGTLTPSQGTSDANGQAVASVTNTAVGPVTLTATLDDGTTASVDTLYFTAVKAATATATVDPVASIDVDTFADKLKGILIYLGHDVEAVYSEAVALAKKL